LSRVGILPVTQNFLSTGSATLELAMGVIKQIMVSAEDRAELERIVAALSFEF